MKFQTVLLIALTSDAEGSRLHFRTAELSAVHHMMEHLSNATAGWRSASNSPSKYGSLKCPCVGIDNLEGITKLQYGKQTVDYPADVGGRCGSWENDVHPDCKGKGDKAPSWCHQAWCYVDPCNCDIEVPPKPSAVMTHAKTQGRPIHYSYATCGGVDTWSTDEMKKKAQEADNAALCTEKVDEKRWGKSECRCIGIDGQEGVTKVSEDGQVYDYPADAGARCSAWESENHPSCSGDKPPTWCKEAWCYVDPCSCDLDAPSKPSEFLPDAKYQGRPVHYSYATCGAEGSWPAATEKELMEKKEEICGDHGDHGEKSAAQTAGAAFTLACAAIAAF